MRDSWILWGIPPWGGPAVKIMGGRSRDCWREMRTRERQGWTALRLASN